MPEPSVVQSDAGARRYADLSGVWINGQEIDFSGSSIALGSIHCVQVDAKVEHWLLLGGVTL